MKASKTNKKQGNEEKVKIEKSKTEDKTLVAEKKELLLKKTKDQDKYIYAYGITDSQEIKLDFKGLKDKPIKKINFKGIVALISYYPELHPVVKESEAMHYAEILNKLAVKTTIIPMAFGTVFKNEKILKTVLAKSYQVNKKTLELIKDKIELGVKVVKNKSEQGIEEIPPEIGQQILGELNKLSVKNVQGDKFSERLLLNNSFLIERNKFDEFSSKIGDLEKKYSDLKFIYTGPWPPYSFVNLKIRGG